MNSGRDVLGQEKSAPGLIKSGVWQIKFALSSRFHTLIERTQTPVGEKAGRGERGGGATAPLHHFPSFPPGYVNIIMGKGKGPEWDHVGFEGSLHPLFGTGHKVLQTGNLKFSNSSKKFEFSNSSKFSD
eukprot:407633-Pelagomonas_calceolata.AAC.2